MPLNVRRFYSSVILFLSALITVTTAFSQQPSQTPQPQTTADKAEPIAKAPTAAEVMRDRIAKAKAYIAVRNYNAAIYELENIRRETSDPSVNGVANVLLMNSYLEQNDHKRAQALLNQFYNEQKTTKPGALDGYSAVAAQIVKGARSRVERYRSLGLNVSDRNLPLEALNDLERMRETLELVVSQSKEISTDKTKTAAALGLLEEATNSRVLIARDDYDARRWRDAVADSREAMASSRSVIFNAVNGESAQTTEALPPVTTVKVADTQPAGSTTTAINDQTKPSFQPVAGEPKPQAKPAANQQIPPVSQQSAGNIAEKTAIQPALPERTRVVGDKPAETQLAAKPNTAAASQPQPEKPSEPVDVGSLLPYAEEQSAPVYTSTARSMRASGVVKVEVLVDEQGNVAEVQKATGHTLLQGSAKDAIRKWKFRPILVGGQPVKAVGFVNFNFSL